MALFDRALIEKYNQPGPRYTSYPTAPHLTEEFGDQAFKEALHRSNSGDRPLSLYVHLPFCKSLCLFCACNMVVTSRRDRIEYYLDTLDVDIGRTADEVADGRQVAQLHWGGGTPSYLSPSEIRRLGALLRSRFEYADDIEASVEIDPRNVNRDHVLAFGDAGFNRVSLGVQDLNAKVQETVNRVQPFEMTAEVLGWCRDMGVKSVNLDLMYGLPHQTPDGFAETLEAVLTLEPNRIALFNYAHVPWMKPHQNALSVDTMPNPSDRLTILEASIERLTEAGYCFIGMDHFAKPDDPLTTAQEDGTLWRNFQGYTTRGGVDLLGFGISSLGLFEGAYYQRAKDLKSYYAAIESGGLAIDRGLWITPDDRLRRYVIMALMCHYQLDVLDVGARFEIDFWQRFAGARDALRQFEDDGLVRVTPERIDVTEPGRLLIRNIAMNFDAYLDQKAQKFSRTV